MFVFVVVVVVVVFSVTSIGLVQQKTQNRWLDACVNAGFGSTKQMLV